MLVQRSWRYVRAGLITLALFWGFVAGWPARIPKLVRGWPPSLARLALLLPSLQEKVLRPFAPAAGLLDITSEDWALFTGTGGRRYRMWIEGRVPNGAYRLLYRAHDPAHTYRAGALEYRRVLNIWNPHHDWISSSYPAFTRWVAREVFRDYPRFQSVRVRMEEGAILPHGTGFAPSGHFAYEELVERKDVAP